MKMSEKFDAQAIYEKLNQRLKNRLGELYARVVGGTYAALSTVDEELNQHNAQIAKVAFYAAEVLNLERPDVPEPGTIVEYVLEDDFELDNDFPDYKWGKVENFEESMSVIFQADDEGSMGYEDAFKWRYPGEKEWRE